MPEPASDHPDFAHVRLHKFTHSTTITRLAVAVVTAIVLVLPHDLSADAVEVWSEPVKLGPNVNGPSDNHFPFITADLQRLYLSAALGALNEDVYVCVWDSAADDWEPRQKLGPEINTVERELSPCESPDRQYLWFIRYTPQSGYDLYYSPWDSANTRWGGAINAGPQFNGACINWSVSISPDSKRMFLVHGVRPGTVGCEGNVLWVSYWNAVTQWWDTLIWMGSYLNAASAQHSATMSLDTSFLYVASGSSWPGVIKYGASSDLFAVRNNPPLWDSIFNLGMPPNSYDRDESISISADGRLLFFSSYRDTLKSSPDIFVSERSVSVGVTQHDNKPTSFALEPISPNPFNGTATLTLTTAVPQRVTAVIHNALGQRVAEVFSGPLDAGRHRFSWNAAGVASGIYFVRVVTGSGDSQVQKALYIK